MSRMRPLPDAEELELGVLMPCPFPPGAADPNAGDRTKAMVRGADDDDDDDDC